MILDVKFIENSQELNADFSENEQIIEAELDSVILAGGDPEAIYNSGYEAGVESGKKAEYDAFWDNYQDNGNRTNYDYAFRGYSFNDKNFYPKYDIKPTGDYGKQVFYSFTRGSAFSLKDRLNECGVILDTSACTTVSHMFAYNSKITEIPTIDVTGITTPANTAAVFSNGYWTLTTIEKIITKEEVTYASWFLNDKGLQHITFEGVIGRSIDFTHAEYLSVASMKSVISHLKNYAGTDKELTYSVKFINTCWARLEKDSTAPDGDTWKNYVGTLGWLI